AEAWLRSSGRLDGGLVAPGADTRRRVLNATPKRENAVMDSGPRGTAVFEKRTRSLTLSALQKATYRAGRFTTPLLHEWSMRWRAREEGVRVPEPVAAGAERGFIFPKSDFLITEALPGTCLFSLLENEIDAIPAPDLQRLATTIGKAVAGLHRTGITFPDLY